MVFQILIALAILLAGLIIYLALSTPKVVKISRSQRISSSAERLFRYINNPRLIQEWNPFVDGDRSVKIEFGGPLEGVDAHWSWEGVRAGAGRATIIQSESNRRVSLRLDFKKPFHVTNFGEYVLNQQGADTEVTWTINEFAAIPRVMSRLVNLERMIGKHFERGLSKLKLLAESAESK